MPPCRILLLTKPTHVFDKQLHRLTTQCHAYRVLPYQLQITLTSLAIVHFAQATRYKTSPDSLDQKNYLAFCYQVTQRDQ